MNTPPILSRAVAIPHVTGRTIEGVAYRYAHPSRVTDDGHVFYLEQILSGADTKSIRDRGGAFPLLVWHSRTVNRGKLPPQSIGQVQFRPVADTQLEYTAVFDRSRLADEMLEMVAESLDPSGDDLASDVSVSFRPLRPVESVVDGELLVSHAAIALRELSVVPTGTGQHADAKVLVMRAHGDAGTRTDIDARLRLLGLV